MDIGKKVVGSLLIAVLVISLACIIAPLEFWGNDDTIMQAIMSGATSGEPTPYAIFTNIVASTFVSTLFSIAPTIPWWLIFLECNMLFAIGSFAYATMTMLSRTRVAIGFHGIWQFILALIASTAFFWYFIVRPSYTFTALSLASASIACHLVFCFCDTISQDERKGLALAIAILSWSSCCIRIYCGLIGLAFMAATWVFGLFYRRHENLSPNCPCTRHSAYPIALAAILAVTSWGINSAAYSTEEWTEFSEVNQARSVWMDFHRCSYDDHPDLYAIQGWDENLYWVVYAWFFMDERVNKDAFTALAGDGQTPSLEELASDFAHGTGSFSHAYPIGLIAVLIAFAGTIISVSRTRWPAALLIIPVGASILGLVILWFVSRTYMHVMMCALFPSAVFCWLLTLLVLNRGARIKPTCRKTAFITLYTLAMVILIAIILPRYIDSRYRLFAITFLPTALYVISAALSNHKLALSTITVASSVALCLFSSIGSFMELQADEGFREQLEDKTSSLRMYANSHPDDFFVFEANLYSYNAFEMTPKNAISWGGWEYYAPWRSIVAASIGHPNGIYIDVLLDDNAYFITNGNTFTERIRQIISDRTGKNIAVEAMVEMENGVSIYKYSALD